MRSQCLIINMVSAKGIIYSICLPFFAGCGRNAKFVNTLGLTLHLVKIMVPKFLKGKIMVPKSKNFELLFIKYLLKMKGKRRTAIQIY